MLEDNELLIFVSPHNWYNHILKRKNNRPLKIVEHLKNSNCFKNVMVVNRIHPKKVIFLDENEKREIIKKGKFYNLLYDTLQRIYYLEHCLPFGFLEKTFLPGIIEKCSNLIGASHKNLWIFDPKSVYLFSEKYKKNIFDAYDDWAISPLFESKKRHLKYINKGYKRARENADLIFVNTTYMQQKYFNSNKNVYLLPNSSSLNIHNIGKKSKSFGDKKTIGYVGHIHNRIDLEILEKLLIEFPDYNVIFLGENHLNSEEFNRYINKYSNLRLLGSVEYNELVDFIYAFDVAIVPHLVNSYTLSQDSMKIYDFLSCGKAIVTTSIPPSNILPKEEDFIYIAYSSDEFIEKVKIAIKNNNEYLKRMRMDYMLNNTWESRTSYICKIFKEVEHG